MTHPNKRDSEIVVELAQTFAGLMLEKFPGWSRAFFRFYIDELQDGASASFERAGEVTLLSAMREGPFYDRMAELARELHEGGVIFKVLLLTMHSNLDYRVDYEHKDSDRWRITKLDGATGIPLGLN
ncbi:hypothetical protein GmRootV213_50530 (plasmid) [Variovorax sp. V213]|uniref:hypothetical protein n=1 Tax=Variovorax sp. V213 TaxID=3065955 RepID=UPI0034E89D67